MDSIAELEGRSPRPPAPLSDSLIEASQPYVGRWSRLVSTTNWEKGRIIVEWRESLVAQGRPVERVFRRSLGSAGRRRDRSACRPAAARVISGSARCRRFAGLYWSHFQAALDWTTRKCGLKARSTAAGRWPRCASSGGRRWASWRSIARDAAEIVTSRNRRGF